MRSGTNPPLCMRVPVQVLIVADCDNCHRQLSVSFKVGRHLVPCVSCRIRPYNFERLPSGGILPLDDAPR
jgi:hypothetical protein